MITLVNPESNNMKGFIALTGYYGAVLCVVFLPVASDSAMEQYEA